MEPTATITIDTYEAALQFVENLQINSIRLGLSRMQAVLETLGNPQDSLPLVHIAGTNGKGSTTAMLSAILIAAGYQVGTFTSPHLIHLRERIALNGNPILQDDFQYEVESLKKHLETHQVSGQQFPSFFEFLNILAYRYFQRKNVDIAVFETGLGGRLDSTNVVKHPSLTVITGIGLDHTERLGSTLAAIATEKAGIIKAGSPLVVGPNIPQEALDVIHQQATELETPTHEAGSQALVIMPDSSPTQGLHLQDATSGKGYWLSLLGPYQKDNLSTVLACVSQLRLQGFDIQEEHIQQGLRSTHWAARFQYFDDLSLIVDGSHNENGFESLVESLNLHFPNRPLYLLLSLRHNRSAEMLSQLIQRLPNIQGIMVTCGEPADLYHSQEALKTQLKNTSPTLNILTLPTPGEALIALQEQLRQNAASQPVGLITGSLYTAGAVLASLSKQPA